MHYFLTGAPGTGKSTALHRTVSLLGVRPEGFLTYYNPSRTQLYLSPACECPIWQGQPAISHYATECVVATVQQGQPVADPNAFDRLGPPAITECSNVPLLIFDECGNLERDAMAFQQAVLDALDRATPILGVIKPQRKDTWLAQIEAHPNVQIILVIEENRKQIPLFLSQRL